MDGVTSGDGTTIAFDRLGEALRRDQLRSSGYGDTAPHAVEREIEDLTVHVYTSEEK